MYLSLQKKKSFLYLFYGQDFIRSVRIALATNGDRCQFVILRTFKPSKSIDQYSKVWGLYHKHIYHIFSL